MPMLIGERSAPVAAGPARPIALGVRGGIGVNRARTPNGPGASLFEKCGGLGGNRSACFGPMATGTLSRCLLLFQESYCRKRLSECLLFSQTTTSS